MADDRIYQYTPRELDEVIIDTLACIQHYEWSSGKEGTYVDDFPTPSAIADLDERRLYLIQLLTEELRLKREWFANGAPDGPADAPNGEGWLEAHDEWRRNL